MKKDQLDYYIGLFNGYLDGNLEQAKQLEIKKELSADPFLKDVLEQYVQVRANIRITGEKIMKDRFINSFDPIVEVEKSNKMLYIIGGIIAVIVLGAAAYYFFLQQKI